MKMKIILWPVIASLLATSTLSFLYWKPNDRSTVSTVDTINTTNQKEFFSKIDEEQIQKTITENNFVDLISKNLLLTNTSTNFSKKQNSFVSYNGTSSDAEFKPDFPMSKDEIRNSIIENTLKIKNGEISIKDLQKKMKEKLEQDPKLIKDLNLPNKNFFDDNMGDKIFSNSNNFLLKPNAINLISEKREATKGEINEQSSLANMLELEKFINFIDKTESYKQSVLALSTSSSIITVVAWGVAAFYWGAWWMFGGNWPFAVAATAQATVLTITTGMGFSEYYALESEISRMKSLVNYDNGMKKISDLIKGIRREFPGTQDEKLFRALINAATASGLNQIAEQVLKKSMAKSSNKLVEVITSKMIQRGLASKGKFIANKITVISTIWANPVGSVISLFDGVITGISLAALAYYLW